MTNGTFQAGGPFLSEIAFGLYEGHPLKRREGQKAFVFYEFVKKEIKRKNWFCIDSCQNVQFVHTFWIPSLQKLQFSEEKDSNFIRYLISPYKSRLPHI